MPIHRPGTDIQASFLDGRRKRALAFFPWEAQGPWPLGPGLELHGQAVYATSFPLSRDPSVVFPFLSTHCKGALWLVG